MIRTGREKGTATPREAIVRVTCLTQAGFMPMLEKANEALGFDMRLYSVQQAEAQPETLNDALRSMRESDLVFLYASGESLRAKIGPQLEDIRKRVPVACLSNEQSSGTLSTASPQVIATANLYLTYHGEKNIVNLFRYLCREMAGKEIECEPPEPVPWDGVYHPDAPGPFSSVESYLEWYKPGDGPMVGLILLRYYWVNKSMGIEDALIRALEARGMSVLPVFSYSIRDESLKSRGMPEVIEEYFYKDGRPIVDAVIKTVPFLIGKDQYIKDNDNTTGNEEASLKGIDVLKKLGVPVFQPIVSFYRSADEWEASGGLANDIGWSVAMPEFEGVIEPLIVGAQISESNFLERKPIEERCGRLASRIKKWVSLSKKPVGERRVAFILQNHPCASVEATVGGAGGLDSLESLALIMKRMRDAGYNVEVPESGKALIDEIMRKRAISEFRWTSVDSIVKSGGALTLISPEDYSRWFDTLSPKVKARVVEAWGRPPGEQMGEMPPAMVYEGKILITGLRYGNAVVCVQPKRGCAGARCDGQVCKILQDPDVPPTHQYMATYRWLEDDFGADVLIHVGAHGSLEFLPGKNVGLSKDCYPDITIGTIPHLYIYTSEGSANGMTAKRRSYAVLVDHMQPVQVIGGLYDELEEVDRLLGEYEMAKFDAARARALGDLLVDAIKAAKLDRDVRLRDDMPLEELVPKANEALSRIRNTRISLGMHVFGGLPEGEKRVDYLNSAMRYDGGGVSLRGTIANMMELRLADLLGDLGAVDERYRQSHGRLLETIDRHSRDLIRACMNGESYTGLSTAGYEPELVSIRERVSDLCRRIDESREVEALLNGMNGRYVPAGPSGLINRGHDDVLPTGRNFYSLDPFRMPTKAAWKVGQSLAKALLEKHMREEGGYPENIAFPWNCTDIIWADGEDMAQIMFLLGVEPAWQPNGRLKGFTVIPMEKLGRPRIDVTIRASTILRDNFPNCMDIIDEAIQAVASLDEPEEANYPRKHSKAMLREGTAADWRDATLRIFSAKPGTHNVGVDYAILASAWKERKDLSDVFVYCNGYAYGKGVNGKEAYQSLVNSLKTVELTYNKVVSDEYDVMGGGCFPICGGLTAAAREVSGREVKVYYGDTREPEHAEVRDLSDEIRRVARAKLFNPKWIEGMKEHGYKGAGDMMKKICGVYGWEACTGEVDDWVFDDITRTFVLDEEMRKFFEENNPYAMEEISRRLLEANQRGLWNADPELLEQLKEIRLEIEGWLEERAGEGEFQGGSIDIYTVQDIEGFGEKMKAIIEKLRK